jgi:hypothetical protein
MPLLLECAQKNACSSRVLEISAYFVQCPKTCTQVFDKLIVLFVGSARDSSKYENKRSRENE